MLSLLLTLLLTNGLNAQMSKAYLALGGNLTDDYLTELGNSQVGTRLGLNIGPGVALKLQDRWEISVELLYSQNGNHLHLIQNPSVVVNKIKLHYVEVPLSLSYQFNVKKNEKANFYKQSVGGGIAYAHLINHKITAFDGTNLNKAVRFNRENTLLFNVAATSHLNESIALNGKGTISIFGGWTVALRLLFYI